MNSEKDPMVSVIMPAYNGERFVEAAIRSVITQTYENWELLVLDDGSSDGTRELAERMSREDPRIRCLPNAQNLGAAGTRNRGMELCRGAYVAFLDCDDLWLPEKLQRQLALLEATGADICYCSYGIMDPEGKPAREDYIVPERTDFEKLLRENVLGCSTVILRRQLAEQYRFSTEFYHEDYVLWLQLLRDGRTAVGCREVLAQWRYLPDSRSYDKGKSAQNRWKIYRQYLRLPLAKSAAVFCAYAWGGVKKYIRKKR